MRYDYRLLLKILSNTDENTNNQRNLNLGHAEENQNRRKIKNGEKIGNNKKSATQKKNRAMYLRF